MVLRTTHIIYRDEVRTHRDTLFLFGDNYMRTGLRGQAKEMRGEINTSGIVTKLFPSNDDDSFLSDKHYAQNVVFIASDIVKALTKYVRDNYSHLTIPEIGVGLAQLPTKAPRTFAFLQQQLNWLENTISSF